MAIHLVVAKVAIPTVMRFSDSLPVRVTSDPLAVTDSVSKISRTDLDTFTLARAKVPIFRDPFRFLVEIQLLFLTYLSLFFFILGFIYYFTYF